MTISAVKGLFLAMDWQWLLMTMNTIFPRAYPQFMIPSASLISSFVVAGSSVIIVLSSFWRWIPEWYSSPYNSSVTDYSIPVARAVLFIFLFLITLSTVVIFFAEQNFATKLTADTTQSRGCNDRPNTPSRQHTHASDGRHAVRFSSCVTRSDGLFVCPLKVLHDCPNNPPFLADHATHHTF